MYRFLALLSLIALIAALFFWWFQINAFNALEPRWWGWLVDYIKATGNIPPEFMTSLYVTGPFIIVTPALVAALGARARNKTAGDMNSEDIHGSARWANKKDLKEAGLLGKTGAVVGGLPKMFNKATALLHDGPEHIIAFAPTRSGKGIGLVIPTLLSWLESVLVLDIKGENYALTAGWRALIGQKVFKFAPASESGSTRFNPLAEVRIGTDHVIADCQNISMMMIDPDGKGLKDHWMKDGWGWLGVVVLHVVHKIKLEDKRSANLSDVMKFMSAVVDEDCDEDAANEGFNDLLKDMKAYEHGNIHVDEAVQTGCGSMMIKAYSEKSGVHSSAREPLNLYIDPIVSKNIACSDFKLSELMNGERPASLYIVIPPKDIARLRPLIRIVMSMFLNFQMQDMVFENGESKKPFKHKMLMMLDEFTSIGKLNIFQTSLAFMATYGLKAFIIIQDKAQLTNQETGYGREENITSNCHIQIAYAPNKPETAKLISEMTGKATFTQMKTSKSAKHTSVAGGNVSESIAEVARPLMTEDEVIRMKGPKKAKDGKVIKAGDMLIFVANTPAFLGRQYLYFKDKVLLSRSKIPAPKPIRKD